MGPGGQHSFYAPLDRQPRLSVSANGGDPEPVTRLEESRGDNSHRWPVFLPDGVHFLYFVRSFEDGRRGIYMGRADRLGEAPGPRLIESEYAALYVPFESDSTGAVLTVVPDGVPQIQRFDAGTHSSSGTLDSSMFEQASAHPMRLR